MLGVVTDVVWGKRDRGRESELRDDKKVFRGGREEEVGSDV